MKQIYLDYAATTPVAKEVFLAMKPFFSTQFGNPSEPHFLGQKAKKALEEARSKVAKFLAAKAEEIIFTSCATESINLAHKGLVEEILLNKPRFVPHIITSSIEHKAVLATCQHLERLGQAKITYLPVDRDGLISPEAIIKTITPQTVLVSIMYVNNEIGTIQPVGEIGILLKKYNQQQAQSNLPQIYFHTDATQAVQYLDCQVDKLGVDLLSFTGHKFYAPKGIGVLYIRKDTPIIPQQDGGKQEGQKRAGTENLPYIVGLGQAVDLIRKSREKERQRILKLRDIFIEEVLKIEGIRLTGHPQKRAPHIASFLVEGVEGEALLLLLSAKGISVSTGSACTSNILRPSHVLEAMGIPPELSHGSIRFSLGKDTTLEDLNKTVQILAEEITKLRKMAPKF